MMQRKLIGPFVQLITMNNIPEKGPVSEEDLEIFEHAGILIEGEKIIEVGDFDMLEEIAVTNQYQLEKISDDLVALPGFIDAHTHMCWAGSRANDYNLRLQGKTYSEIAASGGGIWDTVKQTRKASLNELTDLVLKRADRHMADGVTTMEIKSGYGLSVKDELKMLQAINMANQRSLATIIPTCLAAHICPKDFKGTPKEYLDLMVHELLPEVARQQLAHRVDIYIDEHAFSPADAKVYLDQVQNMGFDITVHADQFLVSGSKIAVDYAALSADHLEASGEQEIELLANSGVTAVVLPGASIGLGEKFAPARKLLDKGCSLAIASDWNPGSGPMGDLLIQACILGAFEKLSMAETLAGITSRAARALNLENRGKLKTGYFADIIAFPVSDYKEIVYHQGKIKPKSIWKNGLLWKSINT